MNINYNVKLGKINIVVINIKRIIRKLYRTPQEMVSFIFPFYTIIYFLVCYVLHKIFSLDGEISAIVQLYIYFVIYYGYIKSRVLAYDDCFYFSITKLEFMKLNIIWNYVQKIIVLLIFDIFNIFWGTIYLISLSSLKYNFQTIFLLGIVHVLILFICLSANIYVDKNKLDVVRQPEDIRRYMSFIEAIFLSSMLTIIGVYINLKFSVHIQNNLVNNLVSVGTAIFILHLITWILAILSVIKTLNYMLIVKLNIWRRL